MRFFRGALLASLLATGIAFGADSPVRLSELTTEHMVSPIGIGAAQPRLSWKLISNRAGEMQSAYEIRAASSREKLESQPDMWASGKITSDQSVLVPWTGKPLDSRAQVFWQVRVWDKNDKASDWSEPAQLELGLLKPAAEWKGQWISVDLPRFDMMKPALARAMWINAGSDAMHAAATRYVLNLPRDAKVESASIDIAADGLISFYVNGKATLQGSSSHTAPFHADFGQHLAAGRNVIAINSGPVRSARGPGGRNALAAHGVVELGNGQHVEFNTDGSWKATAMEPPARGRGLGTPPATAADTAPPANWFAPNFDDSAWQAATAIAPYTDVAPIRSADGSLGPGRYLRKSFALKGTVAKARLYATALGVYEASINGKLVSDDQLAPGWTDYYKRVMVQTYDVTKLLNAGNNALGILLSDGWFAGRLGWMGPAQYTRIGTRPVFNGQLEVTYADGNTETIVSDNSWKGGPGEIVGSDQQLGEYMDARRAVAWDQSSFDDSAWASVVTEQHDGLAFDPQLGVPVRRLMEITPKKISRMGNFWVVDLGQNIVGHVRLTAHGAAGTTITVSHAEMLNADGSLYTENLRPAISLDTFVLKGSGQAETFEPHFTFHGFRFIGITDYPGELTAENIRGIVVGSDTPDVATFECSNPDVNQLWSNIRWGQRGNFLSVPTDCPQRDERMGWMGDAQVFAPTAAYNADVAAFFTKWMVDVDDGQLTTGQNAGAFWTTSPRVDSQAAAYPVWGDAGVIIPWVMYVSYGDRSFLTNNYDHMAKWVDFSQRRSNNLLQAGTGVGDHLAPIGPRGGAGARGAATGPAVRGGRGGAGGVTTTAVVETAYFAQSAKIVAKAAALLGKGEDAAKYDKLFHDIADAFNKAYVEPDGTIQAGTQTTYILALQFELLPENLRPAAIKYLTGDIEQRAHLSTGFVGVGLINPALTAIGRSDLAYQLLLTDTYPSWLLSVKLGATTMWERWDGWTPESGFQASSMNSFNHYSFGAVGKWLYSGAAGIGLDEAQPGFRHIVLNPQFTTKLSHVKATVNSPYGVIASAWQVANNQATYDVTVPPNSQATLTLPAITGGLIIQGAQVGQQAIKDGKLTMSLVPGTYHFAFPANYVN